MGDRCDVTIFIRDADVARYDKDADYPLSSRGFRSHTQDPGVGEFFLSQVNGGSYDDRARAAAEGLVFTGHHGSCPGVYNAYAFASDGDGRLHEALVTEGEGQLVVVVNEDNSISATDMLAIVDYRRAHARVLQIMKGGG